MPGVLNSRTAHLASCCEEVCGNHKMFQQLKPHPSSAYRKGKEREKETLRCLVICASGLCTVHGVLHRVNRQTMPVITFEIHTASCLKLSDRSRRTILLAAKECKLCKAEKRREEDNFLREPSTQSSS